MKIKLLAAIAAIIALPAVALPQPPGQKEAARPERGPEKMEAKQAKAKAEGKVTAAECRKLHAAQDKQGRKVARQQHNTRNAAAK